MTWAGIPASPSVLVFDGVDDYAVLASNPTLDTPDAFAVEAVIVDMGDGQTWHSLNRDMEVGPTRVWIVRRDTDTVGNYHVWNSANQVRQFTPANSWKIKEAFHMLFTAWVDAGTIYLEVFINGVSVGVDSFAGTAIKTGAGINLHLGRRPPPAEFYKKQSLGRVRFYGRRIQAAEALKHFQGVFDDNTMLIGAWDMNGSSPTLEPDLSGNANHLTLVGATRAKNFAAVTSPVGPWGEKRFPRPEYLSLPGITGNYASTPDSAALDITGDVDLRAQVSDVVLGVAGMNCVGRWGPLSSQRGYYLNIHTDSTLRFFWVEGGVIKQYSSTAALTNLSTQRFVRGTLDVDNDAGGHDLKFYTSSDNKTWTQLGATVTNAGVTFIDNTDAVGTVGGWASTSSWAVAKIHYAEIRNGIDGPVVARFDPANDANIGDTVFTGSVGEVWTINQSGSPKAELAENAQEWSEIAAYA